ncbi:MAG: nicotinate-nucleotide adenylyltransferase [Candidatus Eisenbacteria bacterium]
MRAARGRVRPSGPRVGLFGGTFDPPHLGHLALAEWARVRLKLDRVVFIVAGEPPHKRGRVHSGPTHRLALTRRAVRGNPGFEVSTAELRRKGPSYTVDSVREFVEDEPGARFFLIMGSDMFETFGTWVQPHEILRRATLAVALRPGARAPRRTPYDTIGKGVVWLDNPGLEVSSTRLREQAKNGVGLRYLVPDAVARYIGLHRLYRRGR